MSNLYREIDDEHEFRGETYFEAEWGLHLYQEWLPATPPLYKFACYPGDRFILQALGGDDFLICGVGKSDNPRWGIPLPENKTGITYHLQRHQLKNMKVREAKV